MLWCNNILPIWVAHRELLLLSCDVCAPVRVLLGADWVLLKHLVQHLQRWLHICADRDVCGLVLVDLCWVDVDVHDAGVRGEGLQLAGYAVVEAHSESEQQVRLQQQKQQQQGSGQRQAVWCTTSSSSSTGLHATDTCYCPSSTRSDIRLSPT